MKNFGQFLVERNLISNEALLDCLLEQVSSLPATCQIVKNKNLLSTDHLLEALYKQAREQIGFKEACSSLGLWNAELENHLKNELTTLRTPLGNLLLQKGLINLTDLTKALDEFLSNDSNFNAKN